MKVAVCATQPSLDATVDPRFGRCAYFLIVDSDTMEFEAMQNQAAMAGMGAGIQAAQTVASAGVEAVIAGHFGPNAFHALSQAGIALYAAPPNMTVRQAIEALQAGQLTSLTGPSVGAHAGIGMGPGMGMGMGMGRGMGRGMGGGMGGGWAAPAPPFPAGPMAGPPPPPPAGPGWQQPVDESVLRQLKEQLDALQQELKDIRQRLDKLEGK